MTVIRTSTIQAIKTLYKHHIPPKTIAAALDLKYATVTMYIRGFKATEPQFSAEYVVAAILGIKKYSSVFLKAHHSSGQTPTYTPAFGPDHMEAKADTDMDFNPKTTKVHMNPRLKAKAEASK